MTRLTRKTGKLFGENASPLGDDPEIGQFGSALEATYVGTSDIDTIQALPAWGQGFIGAVTPSMQYPPLPEMTGFGKVLSYQNNYLLQRGIPEWDEDTTYYVNCYCSLNGKIYISNTNQNIGNDPTNDRVNWRVFENGGRSHNLFDIVIKDHVLTYADTYGFTLQGDWAYKEALADTHYGYPDFYAKCIDERNNGTETRITLGEYQVDVVIASNGHTYYDVADKSKVDAYFTANGVAWYYGIDETNERINMPRNNYFFRMASSSPGGINFPGAPVMSHKHSRGTMNITGTMFGQRDVATIWENVTGAFYKGASGKRGNEGSDTGNINVNFDASRSWSGYTSDPTGVSPSIYGRESNQIMVTSPNALLYICTGNTVDEGAQTINENLLNAIEALESQEQISIGLIGDAKDDAIDDLYDAKDAAIEDIQEETATVIEDATEQADRARDEADRAEAAADVAVAGQMQADWTQDDPTKVDYIKNKPTDLVTETGTQTLTNKIISGADNTITNIGASSISAITGEVRSVDYASSLLIPSELAVAVALNPIQEQIEQIQLAKNPNLSIIGDITLNSGNASNFSASDYLQFPYTWNFGNYDWILEVQFTTGNDVTTQQNIINSYYGVAFAIVGGHFVLSISSNGSSWDIANSSTGTYSVQTETTYTVKISWDGTDYKVAYSEDEETFTDDITVTSATIHNATQEFVGASPNLFGAGTAYPFDGTINLNKWQLTVNNLIVWYGMDDAGLASRANVSLNNLDAAGEARFADLQTAINQVKTIETIQNIVTVSGGAVNLVSDKVLYSSTPTGSTTYTFTLPSGTVTASQAFTFELYVNMSTTAYSLTFPSSLTWQGGTAPDMSATGKYFLAFRTMDGGTTWIGNLQGVW